MILGDSMRIKQVLVNLIDNAIKYTPVEVTDDFQGAKLKKTEDRKGGVEVSVYTSAEHAHFEIVDHGIGISPEDLPFVFDRFIGRILPEAEWPEAWGWDWPL